MDVREHLNQFVQPLHELVEFAEDLGLTEVEGFAFRHINHFLLGDLIGLFILPVQFDAAPQNFDNFGRVPLPDILYLLASWGDLFLAVSDHLVGDLDEESSHFIARVVESSNCMDHFNSIHQCRQCLDYLLRSSCVKWLNEFFKC